MGRRSTEVLSLAVLAGLLGLAMWGFIEAVQAEPAIVGSIGVAAAGTLSVVWQQRQAEKARIREAHRDRMSPIYYELLGYVFKTAGEGSEASDPEAEQFFRDLKARQLTLGASGELILAFNAWGRSTKSAQSEGNDMAAVLAWEDLLRAIRRDIGHNDSSLPPGELLRLFIDDFDEHFMSA